MNSVQKIYNAASTGNVENVTHLAEEAGTGEMNSRTVVVLKTDGNAVDRVRNQLITALKSEYGEDNDRVSELRTKLLGEDEGSEQANKPLNKRDIQQSIIYVRASEKNVQKVLDGTLFFAKFPEGAQKHLQRVLAGNARHPDVIKFLDGEPKTPEQKYNQLCRVCAFAASLAEEGDSYSTAYLKGFSNRATFEPYDKTDHQTNILSPDVSSDPVPNGENFVSLQTLEGHEDVFGACPDPTVLTYLNGGVHTAIEEFHTQTGGGKELTATQRENANKFVMELFRKQKGGVCPQEGAQEDVKATEAFANPLLNALTEALKSATWEQVFDGAVEPQQPETNQTNGDLAGFVRTFGEKVGKVGKNDGQGGLIMSFSSLLFVGEEKSVSGSREKLVTKMVEAFDQKGVPQEGWTENRMASKNWQAAAESFYLGVMYGENKQSLESLTSEGRLLLKEGGKIVAETRFEQTLFKTGLKGKIVGPDLENLRRLLVRVNDNGTLGIDSFNAVCEADGDLRKEMLLKLAKFDSGEVDLDSVKQEAMRAPYERLADKVLGMLRSDEPPVGGLKSAFVDKLHDQLFSSGSPLEENHKKVASDLLQNAVTEVGDRIRNDFVDGLVLASKSGQKDAVKALLKKESLVADDMKLLSGLVLDKSIQEHVVRSGGKVLLGCYRSFNDEALNSLKDGGRNLLRKARLGQLMDDFKILEGDTKSRDDFMTTLLGCADPKKLDELMCSGNEGRMRNALQQLVKPENAGKTLSEVDDVLLSERQTAVRQMKSTLELTDRVLKDLKDPSLSELKAAVSGVLKTCEDVLGAKAKDPNDAYDQIAACYQDVLKFFAKVPSVSDLVNSFSVIDKVKDQFKEQDEEIDAYHKKDAELQKLLSEDQAVMTAYAKKAHEYDALREQLLVCERLMKNTSPGVAQSAAVVFHVLKEAHATMLNDINKSVKSHMEQEEIKHAKLTEPEVKSIAYAENDGVLKGLFEEDDKKIATAWEKLAKLDIAWEKTLNGGLRDQLNISDKTKEKRIEAEQKKQKHTVERNQIYDEAQATISLISKGLKSNQSVRSLAAEGSPSSELEKSFRNFVEAYETPDGLKYTTEYTNQLVEKFRQMPPSVMNLFANKGVESHETEALRIVIALTGEAQYVTLPKTAVPQPDDSILGNLETNNNQSQEAEGTTTYKWEQTSVQINLPEGSSSLKPTITHLINNAGGGDCFFYSILNGLNDASDKKIVPSLGNAQKLRTAYVTHVRELKASANSKEEGKKAVGFIVAEETWKVANGKGFADVKSVKDEFEGNVPNIGGNIANPGYQADNAHAAFMADLLKRPVVILSTSKIGGGMTIFDRDLKEGRPLVGEPIVLYYTRSTNGLSGHYQTARVDNATKKYIEERLGNNTK